MRCRFLKDNLCRSNILKKKDSEQDGIQHKNFKLKEDVIPLLYNELTLRLFCIELSWGDFQTLNIFL